MSDNSPSEIASRLISLVNAGKEDARDQLIEQSSQRLLQLTKKMKQSFRRLDRWEQTDDVFQNAMIRLCQSLRDVQLTDSRHYFRLAATQIRRELHDLARHYFGNQGLGKRHQSNAGEEPLGEVGRLARWSDFHEAIESLPAAEREVFGLIWYHGLSQQEAAKVMGLSDRQVRRHWRAARLRVYDLLGGELPE